jgi:uncharacterized cupredoxin-like copper-binding protein
MNAHFTTRAHRLALILLLVVVALALAACGPKGPAVTEVKVTLNEYTISMDKTSIPAGPVKFVIQNVGSLTHEVVLEPADVVDEPFTANDKESEAENIEPGQSATLEWTIDTPGQYQLGCHTPAHYEQGMFTNFTVTAP